MAVPVSAREAFVIAATVVSIAFASGSVAWAVHSAPAVGPCSTFYGDHVYCTQTVTIRAWCHEPAPCPHLGNSTALLGYTFNIWPMIVPNGTPALSVSVLGPNATTDYSALLLSSPFGFSVGWTSPDGLLLVSWPSSIPSGEAPPETTYVICGVAAS